MHHRDYTFRCVFWPADDEQSLKPLGTSVICVDVLSVLSFSKSREKRLEEPGLVVNLATGSHTLLNVTIDEFRDLRQKAAAEERRLNFYPFSRS